MNKIEIILENESREKEIVLENKVNEKEISLEDNSLITKIIPIIIAM